MQNKKYFYPSLAVILISLILTLGWVYLVQGTTIGTDIETVNYLGTGTTTLATTTIGTNFYIDEVGAASTTGAVLFGSTLGVTGVSTLSGGIVNIGTTTLATTTIGTNFYIDEAGNASTTGSFLVDTSTFYIDAANDLISIGTSTTAGILTVGTTSDAMFNITTEGYVGVGTTSPISAFHAYTSAATAAIFEQVGATDILLAKNATGTVLTLDNAGNLTLDTDTFYVDTANNAVAIGTTTAVGVFTVGTSSDAFFNISTEGKVAVGTSTTAGVFTVGTTTGDAIFNINTAGGIVVGNGSSPITNIIFGTMVIDPDPIATSTTAIASTTVTGVTTDMSCFVTPPDILHDDLISKGATTTASGKLGVYIYNPDQSSGGADIDDGAFTWNYFCVK